MPHDLIGVWLTPGDGLMRVAAHRAARSFDFEGIFPAPVGETALAGADEAAQQFELADVLGASSARPTMRAIAERHGNFAVLITRMVWNGPRRHARRDPRAGRDIRNAVSGNFYGPSPTRR